MFRFKFGVPRRGLWRELIDREIENGTVIVTTKTIEQIELELAQSPRVWRELVHHSRWMGNGYCKYNALNPHLRCTVNPLGPCETCNLFEIEDEESRLGLLSALVY